MKWLAVLCLFYVSSGHAAETKKIAESYLNYKNKVIDDDISSRKVLSSLYDLNKKMRSVSEKRSKLTDRVLAATGNVQLLAKGIAELEKLMAAQKIQLGRRMAAMYKFGDQGPVRILFSSASSAELDQTMKFLKIISNKDRQLIKIYQTNIRTLEIRRKMLDRQVRGLLAMKEELKRQENELTVNQNQKAKILAVLQKEREKFVLEMKKLRTQSARGRAIADGSEIDLVNGSFFEEKGNLDYPVNGEIILPFGMSQDDQLFFRLSHKGLLFSAAKNETVRAVYAGVVAFAGELPGYGNSILVDHGDHYYSLYSHGGQLKVKSGDRVNRGQVVATAGRIWPQVGRGIYFEIRHFSDAIDPTPWFKILRDTRKNIAETQF